MSAPKSAYPAPLEELLPKARELARSLGEVPSRNRLMSELRIGAPKAKAILEHLHTREVSTDDSDSEPGSGRRLHLVSKTDSTNADEEVTRPLPGVEGDSAHSTNPAEQSQTHPVSEPVSEPSVSPATDGLSGQTTVDADPAPHAGADGFRAVPVWPVLLLALPAFVSIWSGWVGLGGLTGFGIVHPLPGIADGFALNSAITLPIGVETYAAYALRVWLSGQVPPRARRFAKFSALGSLSLGALGQVAYHLMTAAGMTAAPWWITTLVACLPVAVLGMGAALTHLLRTDRPEAR